MHIRENKFNFKGYVGCHVYVLSGKTKKIMGGYIQRIIIEQTRDKYAIKYQIVFGDIRFNYQVITKKSEQVYTSIENLNNGITICDENCELDNAYYTMKCSYGDGVLIDAMPKEKGFRSSRTDWIEKCRLTIEEGKVIEEYKLRDLRTKDYLHGWCKADDVFIFAKKSILDSCKPR